MWVCAVKDLMSMLRVAWSILVMTWRLFFSHMMPSPCCTGWLAQSGHLWTCWTWCQLHVFNVSLIFVPQVLNTCGLSAWLNFTMAQWMQYFVWVWWIVYLYVSHVFLCSVLVQDNNRCVDCLSEIFWRITKVLGGALLPATRTLELSLSTYGYHGYLYVYSRGAFRQLRNCSFRKAIIML